MASSLETLARLRRLQTAAAKRDFAEAVRAEAAAEAALHEARQAPAREGSGIGETQDAFLLACAFANWLPLSAAAVRNQAAQAAAAGQARDAAAASLRAAEGALEAVSTLQQESEAAARKAALKQAQVRLDEAGARSKARQAVLF